MDAPLLTPHDLIRPWRRATILAAGIATVEFVVILVASIALFAKPLQHLISSSPSKSTQAATGHTKDAATAKSAARHTAGVATVARPRSTVRIMVLNGNGRSGAASTAASELHGLGYGIAGTGNALRQDYATSVVMYRKGFRAEALRLAHDLHVAVVGPLDGLTAASLSGGQIAVIIGS